MSLSRTHLAALAFVLTAPTLAHAQANLTPEQRQKVNAAMQACRPDYSSLCNGVQPGGGRILVCLQANRPKLSPVCAAALAKIDEMRTQPPK